MKTALQLTLAVSLLVRKSRLHIYCAKRLVFSLEFHSLKLCLIFLISK